MEDNLGKHHSRELHRPSAEARAERIIAGELQRRGWQAQQLASRRRNDPEKAELVTRRA